MALATGTTLTPPTPSPRPSSCASIEPTPPSGTGSGSARFVARGEAPEVLALVEHQPVYTMGPRTGPTSCWTRRPSTGADVCWTNRGGDVTWHGPGQLAYPILDLRRVGRDLHAYVSALEGC